MEISSDQNSINHQLSRSKGGLRTMPFIIANEVFEKVASYGLMSNMILYLMREYNMSSATGATTLFLWSAISYFLPVIGAFVSDSYLGRFRVIILGSISSLLGMILLWLTTMIPQANPRTGESATSGQLALLFSSFVLMSIGAGGIRPCSLAFGADQFNKPDNPKNERILQSFFNWYYASVGVSIMVAVTVIVYIQDHKGWKVGFAVTAILMLLSNVLFFLGSPFYIKVKAKKTLFTGFAQVVVVAWKNKDLVFPLQNSNGWYHHPKGSKLVAPTNRLRFLNKACIIRNPDRDLNPDGSAIKPWSLCTVEQVEDLKSLMKVIPLWSTGIMVCVIFSQHSFAVLQATTMNRHITSSFQFPAGSFFVFSILTLTIWVMIYDRIIVPFLSKFTGHPGGISDIQRMGIGILLSCLASIVSALVEHVRRRTAIQRGLLENAHAVVDMSAFWLVPQHCLVGLAEAFNAIAQIKFYYSQFPKSMSSIAVALFSLGMAIGNLVGSLIVRVVDEASKRGGRDSWVSTNLNKGHYDYYYWLIAILACANFIYFLVCSWAYGSEEEVTRVASYGLLPNMILYLMRDYKIEAASGSSILQLWSALSNFMPLIGAFLSDSYLGRFRVIALGSISSFIGMVLLWLTTMIPQAKPNSGDSANPGQLLFLFAAFGFMSIGAGGIRPCSIAFGADQLIRKDNPNNARIIQSYFNWYYASIGLSTVLALTVIVYIQDHLGWRVGFGIPAILMFFAAIMFFLGSPLYVKVKANKSLLTGLFQVAVIAFKNRRLSYPENGQYHCQNNSELITPTEKLRFLNKACIIRDSENDLNPDGTISKPWNIATVDQVEGLKSLIRILPIWSTGIIIYMALTQNSLSILQANTMDRHLISGSSFKIPAATFNVFTIVTLTIFVAFYDRVMIPLLAKYTGRPRGLSLKLRMGLGLVLSVLAMVISAIVEIYRRRIANQQGFADKPRAVIDMSAWWLVPHYCVAGLAEGLNAVGQIEFYYSQLPRGMASLAMALFSLGNCFSSLLGSLLIKVVDRATKGGGKYSWVGSNPNRAHYDYYYWFIAILCFANLLYFIVCCWAYGPSKEEKITGMMDVHEDEVVKEEK
ncbi:Proton-dependent oligopeptide transporter family [Macleaya cordata]|uniref:Proton-dependent oligopeptide transporter family n=1 Tax=Macleaya cordata TaxID=56857 RepID=A0A200RC68_MACCD|nr:Proton-dependent oligopeptide transporter family [Macleaya cordata]